LEQAERSAKHHPFLFLRQNENNRKQGTISGRDLELRVVGSRMIRFSSEQVQASPFSVISLFAIAKERNKSKSRSHARLDLLRRAKAAIALAYALT
jgi:hypothetical protein